MKTSLIHLVPYLRFDGNCEEALTFYSHIFNGTINIEQRYKVLGNQVSDSYHSKILHAQFEFAEARFFACDVFPDRKTQPSGTNVSLSLLLEDTEHASHVFNSLSEDGTVQMPFEKQFWGDWHGGLKDKFGIDWNVNSLGR
ncbi:VOC family protein [Pleomorphovibrio marinus]|uniref:VOC family protein n=1 Tax=Pleomorphovibrio marinus TaxID=2164132 RepID=UPI000E0C40CC|nr:VOC family protein [Pleomorphovibrio marinus]